MLIAVDSEKANEIQKYWNDKFPMMCMEECAELALAISKQERYSNEETLVNLQKEMADVIICISGLCKKYGITNMDVTHYILQKTEKRYE